MPDTPMDRRKIVNEVSIFLIGMGLLYAGLGYFAFTMIPEHAAPIRGVARHVVFGAPLLTLGGTQFLCGILFRVTDQVLFAAIGAVAMVLVGVMALILTGVTIINGLLVAAPLFLAQRLSLLGKAKSESPASESKGSGGSPTS